MTEPCLVVYLVQFLRLRCYCLSAQPVFRKVALLLSARRSNFRSIFFCWHLSEGRQLQEIPIYKVRALINYMIFLRVLQASRARAIEGFLGLYDGKLVRNGFHGFPLKTKSFASAIGAVSIEIRSFGNFGPFHNLICQKRAKTKPKKIKYSKNRNTKQNKTNFI